MTLNNQFEKSSTVKPTIFKSCCQLMGHDQRIISMWSKYTSDPISVLWWHEQFQDHVKAHSKAYTIIWFNPKNHRNTQDTVKTCPAISADQENKRFRNCVNIPTRNKRFPIPRTFCERSVFTGSPAQIEEVASCANGNTHIMHYTELYESMNFWYLNVLTMFKPFGHELVVN